MLVQVGYNANGKPILFLPRWTATGLAFPDRGHIVAREKLDNLAQLKVGTNRTHATHSSPQELH
jgi:hypothetical protein